MKEHGRTVAAGVAAVLLGFGGGVAGSALHPGSRGPVGPMGRPGVAADSSMPLIECALQPSAQPMTGSVQVQVPVPSQYFANQTESASTFLTVVCQAH